MSKTHWVTNAGNHEVDRVMATLLQGRPERVLRVGDPEPTNRYTVIDLAKMGVVGIYEVLT